MPAEFAVGRWQAVVYAVVNRWDRPQIREHRLHIVIGQVSINDKRHRRSQRSSAHKSSVQGFHEDRFVVVRNSRSIRSKVPAHDCDSFEVDRLATGKVHAGDGLVV